MDTGDARPGHPAVSVIIPVYNDRDRLHTCLTALGRQTYEGRVEVIVVDNGSTDGVNLLVSEFPAVRFLAEPQRGAYAARNCGIASATGDVIAFTDADCIPEPAWLSEGVACLISDERIGLVAGRVVVFAADPANPTMSELFELQFAFDQRRYVRGGPFGATANVFTRATVLRDVGVFDGSLESGGDREWGGRVAAGGWRVVYWPTAIVRHPARRTWAQLEERTRRLQRGLRAEGRLNWWIWLRAFLGTGIEAWQALTSPAIRPQWKGKTILALFRVSLLRLRLGFSLLRSRS